MASVFFRGPKTAPRWFARFRDPAGVWRSKRVRVDCRKDAVKIATNLEAQAERRRYGLEAPESAGLLVGELMKRWENGLVNRSAYDDRSRLRLHVLPRFGSMRLADLTLPVLMTWLDELRAVRKLESSTQRHLLNLVSRFLGWCIERGHCTTNIVRMIPAGKRPQHAPKQARPWISDDGTVIALMRALPSPFDLMLYLGNRCGLRLGEICGIRVGSFEDLAAGAFPVSHSYNGPLKEDRRGTGKTKWVPMPADAAAVLGSWIARRKADGATADSFVFEQAFGRCYRKDAVSYRWELASEAVGVSMTWYDATRRSFASRCLSRDVPIDQVAAAMGHASVVTTQRAYNMFIRKNFSLVMTAALGLAPVIPIGSATAPAAAIIRPTETEDENAA